MTIAALVQSYGPSIVTGLVTIEGLGLPVPGELGLVTAAAFAGQGHVSLTAVILASWIGTILGGAGGYWVGRTSGLVLVERYGHYLGLTSQRLGHAREFFENHGAKTIIVARFIAVLRVVAGLFAGVASMRFGVFFLFNAIGGLLWSVAFGLLGYECGQRLPLLEHSMREITVGVVIVAVVVGFVLWRRRANRIAAP